MRRFYLDVGNTRAKWLFEDGAAKACGVVELGGADDSLAFKKLAPGADFVGVSCVKGDAYVEALSASIVRAWGVNAAVAVTPSSQLGLICAYKQPQKLGVDRWLAMLAAWKSYGCGFCIVDCGSAITIDLVSFDGRHLGGYILPGMTLSIAGLLGGTDKVIVADSKLAASTLALGQNTTEAVYNGALFSLHSCVTSAMQVLQEHQLNKECRLILTGGDGALLSQLTMHESVYNEDLVLQGLKLYFEAQ